MLLFLAILKGLFFILMGSFFVWMGSLQIIGTMLPKDKGIMVAEWHGAWIRENVFRLPPKSTDQTPNTH